MTYPRRSHPLRRILALALVAALHVGLVVLLVNGTARRVVDQVLPPLQVSLLDEIKPPPPPPPPPVPVPLPKMPVLVLPHIPPPVVQVKTPPPVEHAITAVASPDPTPPAPPASPMAEVVAAAPAHIPPVLDAARSCRPPQYPPISRRNEEAGAVVLRFLIDVDGQVVDSQIESSSGFDRLDEAARDALSLCRFKPGSIDGRPEKSWARMKYVWKIT